MRSIIVRVERLVRRVRAVESVENSDTLSPIENFGCRISEDL
jgi:hypothetical protein